ncbi:MAG: hypothetical protein IPL98_17790 [Saprospiraceae bacterium]|nr:hypothetical protein [Saprospiraceae bacterium]
MSKKTKIDQKTVHFPKLHLGRMVQQVKDGVGMTHETLGELIGIGKGGVSSRLQNPHFGDTFDLLNVSIALRHDFISPLMKILRDHKIEPIALKAQIENDKLLEEIKELKAELLEKKKEISYLHEFIEHMKSSKKTNSTD